MLIVFSFFISLFGILRSKEQHTIFWISHSSILFVLLFAADFGLYTNLFGVYVFLYIILCLVFTLYTPTISLPDLENDIYFSNERVTALGVLLGVISLFLYILGAGGVDSVTRSWVDIATTRSNFQLFVTNLSQLLFLLSLALLLSVFYVSRSVKSVVFMLIITVAFLALTRVKAYLLPLIFPIMALYINENKNKPFKIVVFGFLFSLSTIFLYLLTTFFRWIGSSDKWDSQHFVDVFQNVIDKGVERNLIQQSTSIFNYYVESDKLLGQTYFSIFNPVFRVFGHEVENPMYLYSNLIYGQSFEMRGSAHPTVYVDAFANFGPFGILTGPFWLLLIHHLYKYCSSKGVVGIMIFYVSIAYSIPLISRGSVYYGTLYLAISLLFMLISHRILCHFYLKKI
ncbi:O-antigen polymerase [Pseudoalteromonas lipolytica]|uniref:Oligosaccharide repeat unit polymerase n=1 Tax=Pseudoalteromonas lipolytica TaxID=570156 RepID=A0A0P7E2M7_9GAMM|nr:O-antigen polymerase [Pseudoalteromonas lipolytica]KPM84276.1 hypothetical protein AOG27_08230 [Pseudoalteromonas lipolytica]